MIELIGFSGGLAPGQLLLQGLTVSRWAHTFGVTKNNTKIIDATFTHGVKERDRQDLYYSWIYLIPTKKIMATSQAIQLEHWLSYEIDKEYDTTFIRGNLPPKRNWELNDKWWCSELYAKGCMDIGIIPVERVRNMNRVSPVELLSIIDPNLKLGVWEWPTV